jgi:hypothetical protein
MGVLARSGLSACLLASYFTAACGSGRLDAFESRPSGLIDDFEDLNNHAAFDVGWWFFVNDESSSQVFEFLPPTDLPGDHGALHTSGGPFTGWGANVGVSLTDAPGGAYDATGFDSERFLAKVGPGSQTAMTVWIQSAAKNFAYSATLTNTWTEYTVPFASTVCRDDPTLRVDASQLSYLQFNFDQPVVFDLWLDQVAFVRSQ